jgi:hypothetical protein
LNPVRAVSSLVPAEAGPKRSYALAMLINAFGTGLLLVSLPLYLTRVVHLSAGQVGLGLTIAATVTLLVNLPIGDLADRRGPLEVAKGMLLLQCGATIAFLFIDNFAGFVAVATIDLLAARAILTAEGALLRRVAGEDAARFRSSTHAITNVGFSVGFAVCAIAIQIGTPTAYHTLIIVDVLSFLGAWAVLRRLPRYNPLPKPATEPRWAVLRDRPFTAFALLGAAMSIEFNVILLLLPLWVADHTDAPRWCIPLSLVINTILVVLFQVRLGGRVGTLRQGGAAWRRSGVFFLLSCSVMGFAAGLPSWYALLLLVAAVSLHTFGEILHTASGFVLSLGLPPAHAQGQYDGFLGIVGGISAAAAPALLLGPVLSLGLPGLIGLGAFFALTGMLMPAVARWGERTRPAASDLADRKPALVME